MVCCTKTKLLYILLEFNDIQAQYWCSNVYPSICMHTVYTICTDLQSIHRICVYLLHIKNDLMTNLKHCFLLNNLSKKFKSNRSNIVRDFIYSEFLPQKFYNKVHRYNRICKTSFS